MKMPGIESIYRRLCSLLLVAMLTPMSVQATSETTVGNMSARQLDAFVSGLDTQCSTSPQFDAFRQALHSEKGDAYRLTPMAAKAQIEPSIRSVIGDIRIIEETEGYQLIEVDVTGATWRQVVVESIEFLLGKENGIWSVAVVFSPPSETAMKTFQTRIRESAKRMANDPDNDIEASTGIDIEDGRVRLWCDWSN